MLRHQATASSPTTASSKNGCIFYKAIFSQELSDKVWEVLGANLSDWWIQQGNPEDQRSTDELSFLEGLYVQVNRRSLKTDIIM